MNIFGRKTCVCHVCVCGFYEAKSPTRTHAAWLTFSSRKMRLKTPNSFKILCAAFYAKIFCNFLCQLPVILGAKNKCIFIPKPSHNLNTKTVHEVLNTKVSNLYSPVLIEEQSCYWASLYWRTNPYWRMHAAYHSLLKEPSSYWRSYWASLYWRTSQTPNIFHVKRPWREGIDNRNFIPPHLPLRSPLINNLADGKVEVTLGTKKPRCEQAYCSEFLMLQNISSSCVKVWHPNESSTKSSIQIRVVRTR